MLFSFSKLVTLVILVALIVVIIVVVFVVETDNDEIPPSVVTKYGEIQGYYKRSTAGHKYMAFEGIPYALPPIGERRFNPPEPIQSWATNSTLSATNFRAHCLGLTWTKTPVVEGEEDCLYLNIYAPEQKDNSTLLPVLFWLGGTAFQFTPLSGFEQQTIIDEQLVFVSVSYRQGTLGFLSTDDDVVPGNMGLKDQATALKWVSENIQVFGGDPAKITLAGLGSGAASVHFHYLSPWSQGLFRNGISFSGSALNSWAIMVNGKEKAMKIGEKVGCVITDTEKLVECLRGRPATDLTAAETSLEVWHNFPLAPLSPTVEKNSNNSFLDSSPMSILNTHRAYDVPWLVGRVSDEALAQGQHLIKDNNILNDLNDNWNTIAPFLLDLNSTVPKWDQLRISRAIRDHYFGNDQINHENGMKLIQLMTDRFYGVDLEEAVMAQARANTSPTYLYYYSFKTVNESLGVAHGEDVFSVTVPKRKTNAEMRKEMIKLWMSAIDNRPQSFEPWWNPVTRDNDSIPFLNITGPEKYTVNTTYSLSNREFWKRIGLTSWSLLPFL